MLKYNLFLEKLNSKKYTSGIAFIYNDSILLVKSKDGNYGPPKGKADKKSETVKETSIREVEEEIGVDLDKDVKKKLNSCEIFEIDKDDKTFSIYIYKLSEKEYDKYFGSKKIDKKDLQKKEIKSAKFYSKKEAKDKIKKDFKGLLKFI